MGYYTEAAKAINEAAISPMDIPTFFLESTIMERKLFEGLIELDFAEVYNEAGLIYLSEEEQEAAGEVAEKKQEEVKKNLFQSFLNALSKAFTTIREKLQEFLNKTKGLAKMRLDEKKCKECKIEDVWYKNYSDCAEDILGKCAKVMFTVARMDTGKITREAIELARKSAPEENKEDVEAGIAIAGAAMAMLRPFEKQIAKATKEVAVNIKGIIAMIPTTKEEADEFDPSKYKPLLDEAKGAIDEMKGELKGIGVEIGQSLEDAINLKIPNSFVIPLGEGNINDLSQAVTLGGVFERINKVFDTLKKPEAYMKEIAGYEAKSADKKVQRKINRSIASVDFAIKLNYFAMMAQVTSTTARIARRNYSTLVKFSKGKINNETGEAKEETQEKTEESAIIAGIGSDLLCESIFGI